MIKIFKTKQRWCIVLAGTNNKLRFLYNNSIHEAALDIYWAFRFAGATSAKVLSSKSKQVVRQFDSLKEWCDFWDAKYPGANYFVFADRVQR
jgi:hypothetical protein